MSKKKKRKTRKQKQRAQVHKKEYLENVNKKINQPIKVDKENASSSIKSASTEIAAENKFTSSNIKRSIIYTLFFILIIAILYILELNFHYFSDLSNSLIFFITK